MGKIIIGKNQSILPVNIEAAIAAYVMAFELTMEAVEEVTFTTIHSNSKAPDPEDIKPEVVFHVAQGEAKRRA